MPVTQQYWRIIATATNGGGVLSIADIVFYDTNNAQIALAGGTATASSGASPGNAFDGNPATSWSSVAVPSSGTPQWIQYQFTGAVPVVSLSIRVINNVNFILQSPNAFLIQSSPNGTTWTTQNTITSFDWYIQSQVAYFSASMVVGNLRLSQAAIEIVNADSSDLRLSQLSFEAVLNAEPRAKASQLNLETILNAEPRVKLSQIIVEVIYPFVETAPKILQQFLLP